jgi:hypothetical protein
MSKSNMESHYHLSAYRWDKIFPNQIWNLIFICLHPSGTKRCLWISWEYFIKDKKYTRNPKESSNCPEANVGLKQRTISYPQDRLQTGGPKTGDSSRSQYSTTPANNSVYVSRLQLLSTTPLHRANYRLLRKIRLPSLLLLLPPSTKNIFAYRA